MVKASQQCKGQLAFGIQALINRGRFGMLVICVMITVMLSFGNAEHWDHSGVYKCIPTEGLTQMNAAEVKEWNPETKQASHIFRLKSSFLFLVSGFSSAAITLQPSFNLSLQLSLYHFPPTSPPLFLFNLSLCCVSLWFVNIVNMLTFHLLWPHFIVK